MYELNIQIQALCLCYVHKHTHTYIIYECIVGIYNGDIGFVYVCLLYLTVDLISGGGGGAKQLLLADDNYMDLMDW